MKVSKNWLKQLVELNTPLEEIINILPLRSISTKEVTDQFIELDMKGYNRADLLALRGVAQEIAAVTNSIVLFKEPQEAEFAWNKQSLPVTKVEIKDPKLCPMYCVAKIEGLKVEKSSEELIKKLESSGMRTVNNIADITNLVMLEYGQPLHAFDAEKVEGEIIIRTAKDNEEIITLDGKSRKLSSTDLLITDAQKPIGIAGVMGGKNTEVSESTTSILLEAAIFDPISIRKTVTSLGLPSEASKRFQHGLTKKRLLQALNAAIKMYQELGGKLTAVTIVGDFEDQVKKITLTKQKLEDLVGIKFEDSQVVDYLERLNFNIETKEGGWEVEVPYFRLDINIEEDLIEEVARMYGYEKIPAEKVSESEALQTEDPIFKTISTLRKKLVELGLTEVQTYSFYSQDVLNTLGFDESNKKFLVKVANPISAETEYLRMNVWPNLVEALGKNLRKGFADIAIFEIGKIYEPNQENTPKEEYRLAIALSNGTDNPIEELISITEKLGLDIELKESKPEGIGSTLFHPKRFVTIERKGQQIGGLSEVHLKVLDQLGVNKRVSILEINL